MAAFEHVITLVSFVYALALTYLLARIVELFDARERVTFSGLQALLALNAILLVFDDWLALWPLRTVSSWDFLSIADNFVLGVMLFLNCAIAAPRTTEGQIDLDTYYEHARKPFYWLIFASIVVAELGNLDFLKSSDPTQFRTWTIASIIAAVPPTLAVAIPARWAQWTAGLSFTLVGIVQGIVLGNLR